MYTKGFTLNEVKWLGGEEDWQRKETNILANISGLQRVFCHLPRECGGLGGPELAGCLATAECLTLGPAWLMFYE